MATGKASNSFTMAGSSEASAVCFLSQALHGANHILIVGYPLRLQQCSYLTDTIRATCIYLSLMGAKYSVVCVCMSDSDLDLLKYRNQTISSDFTTKITKYTVV
ncbi:hypothetical protein RRG08_002818 [Elysia crispata]|uniref:Uncharacterized protein n=1 Tax=Elysia crispata TaxID=231223 RepID=A0AAE0XU44_9GAST|nr:hypothetical protein RRG08_002818 [Elysia crispata]